MYLLISLDTFRIYTILTFSLNCEVYRYIIKYKTLELVQRTNKL